MASRDKIDIEFLGELCHHVLVEGVGDAALGLVPVLVLALFRVSPTDVAQQTLVRNVGRTRDHFEVSAVVELLRQAAMHTEDLVVDKGCHRELIKHGHKLLEQPAVLLIVTRQLNLGLPFPLQKRLVEPVNEGQVMCLMVATEEEEVLRVLHFKGKEEQNRLHLHRAAALVVAQEEVVGFRWPALHLEDLAQVGVLTVDVSNDLDRWL